MALTPKVKDELARVPVSQESAQSAEVAAILARVMDYEASCIEEKAIEPTEPVVE